MIKMLKSMAYMIWINENSKSYLPSTCPHMFIVDIVQESHPSFQQMLDTDFTSTAAPLKMIQNRPYTLQQSSASWCLGNIWKRCWAFWPYVKWLGCAAGACMDLILQKKRLNWKCYILVHNCQSTYDFNISTWCITKFNITSGL